MRKILKKTLAIFFGSHLLFSPLAMSHDAKDATHEEKKLFSLPKIHDNLSIHGLLELEAYTLKRDGGDSDSDLVLATFQLGSEFKPTKFLSLHATLLFEEDETEPMELDEAFLRLGNSELSPFYLQAGKFYLPFGNFETNMITDPLTLELAETNQSAIQIGFEDLHGFHGSIFAFNGDIGKNDDYDRIKYGFNLGYSGKFQGSSFDAGISYISDLLDSDSLEEWFKELKHEVRHNSMRAKISDDAPGISLYTKLFINDFTVFIEYITQLKDTEYSISDRNTKKKLATIKEDKFSAWHIEASYETKLLSQPLTFSLSYQGTNNLGDMLPENSYLASISYELFSGISTKVEYNHNDFKKEMDEDIFTAQLSIEF